MIPFLPSFGIGPQLTKMLLEFMARAVTFDGARLGTSKLMNVNCSLTLLIGIIDQH